MTKPDVDPTPRLYDVCLSFAGEQRDYVRQVADNLRRHGINVFYDEFEKVNLWGKDLYEHLDWVYRKAARYCVLFVSADYSRKVWTSHERKSAQARALAENQEYVLPVRFDDTELPGLRPTVGYLDIRGVPSAELAGLIEEKLNAANSLPTVTSSHPTSVKLMIAMARRSLSSPQTAVDVHDILREQVEHVRNLSPINSTEFHVSEVPVEYRRRLNELESGIETLLALVATCAYWGDEKTDGWWFDDIGRFSHVRVGGGGATSLINLTGAAATYLLYASGVAAVAARRWPLVGRLLVEPTTTDVFSGTSRSVATLLSPSHILLATRRASLHLHDFVRPVFVDDLSIGASAFAEAWERFEYLTLVAAVDDALANNRGWRGSDVPHIRAIDSAGREYQPLPSVWLRGEIDRLGGDYPLLLAGFCGGSADRLRAAQDTYDERFTEFAHAAAWSTLPMGGGVLPSGTWYPDEAPRFTGP